MKPDQEPEAPSSVASTSPGAAKADVSQFGMGDCDAEAAASEAGDSAADDDGEGDDGDDDLGAGQVVRAEVTAMKSKDVRSRPKAQGIDITGLNPADLKERLVESLLMQAQEPEHAPHHDSGDNGNGHDDDDDNGGNNDAADNQSGAEQSEQEGEEDEAAEQQQQEEVVEDEAAVTKRITKWRAPKMRDYLKNRSLDPEGLKAALCQRIVASMLHPTAVASNSPGSRPRSGGGGSTAEAAANPAAAQAAAEAQVASRAHARARSVSTGSLSLSHGSLCLSRLFAHRLALSLCCALFRAARRLSSRSPSLERLLISHGSLCACNGG
jgi:hypothetical protein